MGAKSLNEGWTFKPLAVDKSINLGITNKTWLKNFLFVMSSPCTWLTGDVTRQLPAQTWFVLFSVSVQPLFSNFGWVDEWVNLGSFNLTQAHLCLTTFVPGLHPPSPSLPTRRGPWTSSSAIQCTCAGRAEAPIECSAEKNVAPVEHFMIWFGFSKEPKNLTTTLFYYFRWFVLEP